jgi:hypothetical protein
MKIVPCTSTAQTSAFFVAMSDTFDNAGGKECDKTKTIMMNECIYEVIFSVSPGLTEEGTDSFSMPSMSPDTHRQAIFVRCCCCRPLFFSTLDQSMPTYITAL